MAVVEEKKMILPVITQTLLIWVMTFFHIITTVTTYLDITPVGETTLTISEKTLTITEGMRFFGYTMLFVFLVYVTFYVTLGMKQLMIHHYYRGGKLKFRKAFKLIRRRWWGLMGYAFSSTIVHMIKYIHKMIKGELDIKSLKEAIEFTGEVKPDEEHTFTKPKKRRPLRERIWMGLNYFTMPAIVIEGKLFHPALLRSLRMSLHNLVDLYIKKSNVNKIFRLLQALMITTNIVVGGALGVLFGYAFGLDPRLSAIVAAPLFGWIGGGTTALLLNNLNTAYITIMYIHTLDDINNKEGYTRFELEKIEHLNEKEQRDDKTRNGGRLRRKEED